jgi:hypothetical protein
MLPAGKGGKEYADMAPDIERQNEPVYVEQSKMSRHELPDERVVVPIPTARSEMMPNVTVLCQDHA